MLGALEDSDTSIDTDNPENSGKYETKQARARNGTGYMGNFNLITKNNTEEANRINHSSRDINLTDIEGDDTKNLKKSNKYSAIHDDISGRFSDHSNNK